MNTRLTVADARIALEGFVKGPSAFIGQLNQVQERLIYSGKWKGAIIKATFDSSAGFISLPPEYLSVIGSTFNHWPTKIYGEFHTYFESGPGTPLEASGWLGQLQDMGDGNCSQLDIIKADARATPPVAAKPGTIRIFSTAGDNGRTIRLFGTREETDQPVVDAQGNLGETLTLNAPFVDSANHFTELTDVIKDGTLGAVTAWILPTGGGTTYQIATWRPSETRPRYRRYRTGTTEQAIQVLCQRRFMPVRAETDWVIPGNLAALKFGLRALRHEDVGYDDSAKKNWDSAIHWLNDESVASRGGALPSVPNVGGMGGYDGIPEQH